MYLTLHKTIRVFPTGIVLLKSKSVSDLYCQTACLTVHLPYPQISHLFFLHIKVPRILRIKIVFLRHCLYRLMRLVPLYIHLLSLFQKSVCNSPGSVVHHRYMRRILSKTARLADDLLNPTIPYPAL